MNDLTLVKQEHFGEIEADIYSNGKDMFMTINQLAACLEYSSKSGIENILTRNHYLKEREFSSTHKLWVDGKQRETRIFNEDGIYEITMLSGQPKAKDFRAWIRTVLKALRKGNAKLVPMTDYQMAMASTRQDNAKIRKAQLLEKIANQYDGTYKQVLHAYATKELTGDFLLPLPQLAAKTYSAQEIGDMLGITPNMVGILTNRHKLKTDQYGAWFNDKSKYSNKEVPTFRYYESVVPVLQELTK